MKSLYSLVRLPLTNCHKLAESNNRNLFSHSSRGWKMPSGIASGKDFSFWLVVGCFVPVSSYGLSSVQEGRLHSACLTFLVTIPYTDSPRKGKETGSPEFFIQLLMEADAEIGNEPLDWALGIQSKRGKNDNKSKGVKTMMGKPPETADLK